MIGKLLFKGMIAGILAGLVAFAFAHHFGEPQVDRAIGLEKSMSAHAHHHGASADGEEEEVFSRQTQSGIGLMTGMSYGGADAGDSPSEEELPPGRAGSTRAPMRMNLAG